ncbi:bacteriocin [Serratia rubidaea]|nr:bacteriocin [Serratia rubidaea]WBF45094.1 bacteriocin [Serratia rubidaea]
MKEKNGMRELTEKELKEVAGGWGVTWGKVDGGGFYIQGFLGKKPGKG